MEYISGSGDERSSSSAVLVAWEWCSRSTSSCSCSCSSRSSILQQCNDCAIAISAGAVGAGAAHGI